MKITSIEKRVQEIHDAAGNGLGTAHGLEDDLYFDVLQAIAKGSGNPREMAEAALKTREVEIWRVYE